MIRIFYFLIIFINITELNASLVESCDLESVSSKNTFEAEKQNLQLQAVKDEASYMRQRNCLDLQTRTHQYTLDKQYSGPERQLKLISGTLNLNEKINNNEKDIEEQRQKTTREFEDLQKKTNSISKGILGNIWDATYDIIKDKKMIACCCIATCGVMPLLRYLYFNYNKH